MDFLVLPGSHFSVRSVRTEAQKEMIRRLKTKTTLFNGRYKHLEVKMWVNNWVVRFQQIALEIALMRYSEEPCRVWISYCICAFDVLSRKRVENDIHRCSKEQNGMVKVK